MPPQVPPERPTYFYHLTEPGVIVGDAAYEEAIASGAHPADIVVLSDLLTGTTEILETHDPLEVDSWQRVDYIRYGKWLLDVVDIPLKHTILQNAYQLGIGPEPQRIYRKDKQTAKPRFNGYRDFYQQIEAPDTVRRGTYDHLKFRDVMKYVKQHADRAAAQGIRPTVGLFEELAKKEKGPSNEVAKRIVGKPYGQLLDMAGYPEPRNWTNNDYIEWGVKFMRANDGQKPTHSGILQISKRFRGPSDAAIARRFGGIWSFQTVVMERYEQYIDEQQQKEKEKFASVKHEIEMGTMPEALLAECEPDEARGRIARFWVARRLLPHQSQLQLLTLVTEGKPSHFVGKLRKKDPSISLAHVEVAAAELDVFEDIWPPENEFLTYLKVS